MKDNYMTPRSKSRIIEFHGERRRVCPSCFEHEQGDPSQVSDCKNLFVGTNGEIIDQCCCYSKEHGTRNRKYY